MSTYESRFHVLFHVSYIGDRPMSIIRELEHEMPADISGELASLLAG